MCMPGPCSPTIFYPPSQKTMDGLLRRSLRGRCVFYGLILKSLSCLVPPAWILQASASNQNGPSTFNDSNQLTEDDNFNYIYDENGNQVQKTNKSTLMSTVFEYDADNKLIRVTSLDKTVNYKYDGLGRRIEKEVTDTGATTTTGYIYDNEDILLELDGSNNITARYTYGPRIDEPLIIEKSGQFFFYHVDGLGSVTELTDSIGTVAQSYTYSSFGQIETQLDLTFVQPFTYTSREFDPETGLHYYRARTYGPAGGEISPRRPRSHCRKPIGAIPAAVFHT